MSVEVIDQTGTQHPPGPVADLVEAVLEAEGVAGAIVVAFVDDRTMAELNGRYRGIEEPTDVLSFRYADEGGEWPDRAVVQQDNDVEPYRADTAPDLGEVVVCLGVVRRYAEDDGIDAGRQLAWTVVHGVLHLVGYDHEHDSGEMREREQVLLERFNGLVTAVPSPRPGN
jgi:probable rRNA maturation factor